jgi:Subtilase family
MGRVGFALMVCSTSAISQLAWAQGVPPGRVPPQAPQPQEPSRRGGVQVGPVAIEVNLGSLLALRKKDNPTQVPSQLVFTLIDSASVPTVTAQARVTVLETIPLESLGETMVVVSLARGDTPEAATARLSAISGVIGVQPNNFFDALQQGTATAPLPKRLSLHGLPASPVTGRIVVIDSGVDLGHAAFRGATIEEVQLAPGAGPGAHGTAVVGLLVGNAGPAIGVAQGAQIISLAAFIENRDGATRAETRYLARAFDQSNMRRPNVMNLSFGGANDPLLSRLLDVAATRGICVVAAGGNGGARSVTPFPASHSASFAVTAVDENLRLYSQATPGAKLDVAALGVDVMSAVPGGYRRLSGTSFSTAIVSGGLLRVQGCTAGQPSAAREAVRTAAQDIGARGRDNASGSGLFRVP